MGHWSYSIVKMRMVSSIYKISVHSRSRLIALIKMNDIVGITFRRIFFLADE